MMHDIRNYWKDILAVVVGGLAAIYLNWMFQSESLECLYSKENLFLLRFTWNSMLLISVVGTIFYLLSNLFQKKKCN